MAISGPTNNYPQQSYAPWGSIDMFEWKVTVTDADNNTAHYDLFVTVDSSGGGPGQI